MTRNVKYTCQKDGAFWSSFHSPTPKSKGLAPSHAPCPVCKASCPRVHQPKPKPVDKSMELAGAALLRSFRK